MGERHGPSRWWYALAGGAIVAGLVAGAVLVVVGVRSFVIRFEGFPSVSAGTTESLVLDETGTYTVFSSLPRATVTIVDPTGVDVPLNQPGADAGDGVPDDVGLALTSFPVDRSGPYQVTVGASAGRGDVTIAHDVGPIFVGTIEWLVAGVAVAGVGVVVGTVLLTVVALRRNRARRRSAGHPPSWGQPAPARRNQPAQR